jgi:hypothetical protein
LKSLTLTVAFAAVALLLGVYAALSYTGGAVDEEQSLEIAREFLLNSPTFRFDGMEETLKLVEIVRSDAPGRWEFVFSFHSRHAGYGDRTGQVLLPVVTPHTAHITVEKGWVVSAVLDGRWDMLRQEMLEK